MYTFISVIGPAGPITELLQFLALGPITRFVYLFIRFIDVNDSLMFVYAENSSIVANAISCLLKQKQKQSIDVNDQS